MSIIQAIILGLIQGLTEFIPVSSSGHLVLFQQLLNVTDGGLLFDVALHTGTLLALIVFFFTDIKRIVSSLWLGTPERRLAIFLAAATIPAAVAGVLIQDLAESTFRSTKLVAVNLILVALLMLLAERIGRRQTKLNKISFWQAIGVGFAQALALVPGVSRSGSTITAGLFMGMERVAATRFAFLLAIPITFGAIIKVVLFSGESIVIGEEGAVFLAGILASFVSGLLAIRFLLKFLQKHSINIFAYYRIALGVAALLLSLR